MPTAGGTNYIRWGRTSCDNTVGTETLYTGVAAGSFWNQQGGGSQYLCLTNEPEFLEFTPGEQPGRSKLYGAEYETLDNFSPPVFGNLLDFNIPCAACYTMERGNKIMIPARVTCPPSWTREYYGYLMSGASFDSHYRISYECMDVDAEGIPGSEGSINGAAFYFTEVLCHGISCPPYADGTEIPCVVCTKWNDHYVITDYAIHNYFWLLNLKFFYTKITGPSKRSSKHYVAIRNLLYTSNDSSPTKLSWFYYPGPQ